MKMKILHLLPREKFTQPYIDFINKSFDSEEHLFLILGKGNKNKVTFKDNVKEISKEFKSIVTLFKEMFKCKKIMLHSLTSTLILLILFIQPWLLHKSNWIIWGGDLYWYKFRKKNIKNNIIEIMRRKVIRNLAGLITHVKGDYELAKKWYGAKGKYYYSFMYPSNLFKEFNLSGLDKIDEKTFIQIGNSANPSNNHLEVFKELEKYKSDKMDIICPLSYGNPEYRDKVIEEGRRMFGNKFNPVVDFMPFEQYLGLLAKIDIAIFNHKRQQAMGNITTLLGLGKKVYIRNDITTWRFCIEHDLKVFNSNGDFGDLFIKIDDIVREKNIKNVKEKFSQEKLIEDLERIFN